MSDMRHQRGMTMWGMIFVLFILGFCLFITFKLFPVYMNDLKVANALKSVGSELKGGAPTRTEIIIALVKRMNIDDFTGVNFDKDLTIQAKGTGREVAITYDVVVPLFGNISLLLDFRHSAYVSGGG